ncbi:DUF5990 family protein [Streptomyces sp. HF10]|uniref:DUF5990 family protein n=1 Tax=Streptomyces sp. HF10 TaxID=2692233 RepID=UPI002E2D21CA|nr:DUF5990 family protein [Streptomyces sp. HF10]
MRSADRDTAAAFAEAWQRRAGVGAVVRVRLCLYRLVGEGDRERLMRWCQEFAADAEEDVTSDAGTWAGTRFARERYTLWELPDGTERRTGSGGDGVTGVVVGVLVDPDRHPGPAPEPGEALSLAHSVHTGGMHLRVESHTLPGRNCGPGPGFPKVSEVEVAVQRKDRPDELLEPQPGDAPTATWTLPCAFTVDGALHGPYVQNRLGGRFVYLSWLGRRPGEEVSRMFRRAKLMLADVAPQVLAEARLSGVLVARLALTDAQGLPLCGRVLPPAIVWSAGEPSDA